MLNSSTFYSELFLCLLCVHYIGKSRGKMRTQISIMLKLWWVEKFQETKFAGQHQF